MRLKPRLRTDRGSVLVLVPAGFLVLIFLGGLAVDSAVAYQRQHQLHDALTAAANDAASAGLSDRAFYRGGQVTLDASAVTSAVCRSMAAQDLSSLHGLRLGLVIVNDSIRIRGAATIDPVFGRAIPGFGDRHVSSTADATLSAGAAAVATRTSTFGLIVPLYCP